MEITKKIIEESFSFRFGGRVMVFFEYFIVFCVLFLPLFLLLVWWHKVSFSEMMALWSVMCLFISVIILINPDNKRRTSLILWHFFEPDDEAINKLLTKKRDDLKQIIEDNNKKIISLNQSNDDIEKNIIEINILLSKKN